MFGADSLKRVFTDMPYQITMNVHLHLTDADLCNFSISSPIGLGTYEAIRALFFFLFFFYWWGIRSERRPYEENVEKELSPLRG